MLTLNQLIAIAEGDGVNVATVERDYVITHLIQRLSSLPESESLTFKGGTALRLVHFQTFRYSADIDLNCHDPRLSDTEAMALVANAAVLLAADLGVSVRVEDSLILYTGPRNQAEPERIKLDIATDELTTDEPIRQRIIRRYPDQTDGTSLPTYGVVEAAAEKLRCVIQRLQCRDLFDIHRLLAIEGTYIDQVWAQFDMEARHRGLDPGALAKRWRTRVEAYQRRWSTEMRRYASDVPDFDRVLRETERALRPVLRG